MNFRSATAADAQAIAALHADSWRRHYRGAYSDEFLDGDVDADRLAVWTERLRGGVPDNVHAVVVEEGGALIGFAYTILDDNPEWGALLDNLHVRNAQRGTGIGTQLLVHTARGVLDRAPLPMLYLWVLEQNSAAQKFYAARGGTCVGSKTSEPPGGGQITAHRIVWPDPRTLCEA